MVTPLARGTLLRVAERAPAIDIGDLAGDGPVLVLAPHPDDETFGCGAAIVAASRAGRSVIVVAVTDGNASHPNSAAYPPERLAALRREELSGAVDTLTGGRGLALFLGYDDQRAPSSGPRMVEAARRLSEVVTHHRPTALWTTWRHDPHCDHRAAWALGRHVAARHGRLGFWEFPVWGRFLRASVPHPGRLRRFDATPFRAEKRAAIACHASQTTRLIADDPEGFVMEAATQAHFLDSPELFMPGGGNV